MSSETTKKRVLFVCNQNRVRSLTAQQLYRERPDLEVRSAGIAENAGMRLSRELVAWADQVFVFSKEQRKIIEARYPEAVEGKPLVCLNLADRYQYKSPALIMALNQKLCPYLGAPDCTTEAKPSPEARARRSAEVQPTVWSALCSLGLAIIGISPYHNEAFTIEPGT